MLSKRVVMTFAHIFFFLVQLSLSRLKNVFCSSLEMEFYSSQQLLEKLFEKRQRPHKKSQLGQVSNPMCTSGDLERLLYHVEQASFRTFC